MFVAGKSLSSVVERPQTLIQHFGTGAEWENLHLENAFQAAGFGSKGGSHSQV